MKIRIIGGLLKGFMIKGSPSQGTRPILARIRKSLFDILRPRIPDSRFLDLFSGTGSVGIEAISRGAKTTVFVEKDRKACDIIKYNLKYCKIEDKTEVMTADVFDFIELTNQKFDIIFAGPPYPLNISDKILKKLSKSSMLTKDTIIIIQHHKRENTSCEIDSLTRYRKEKYGDTLLSFYKNN